MIRAGFNRGACRCAGARAARAIYAVFVNARARHAGEDEIAPVGGNAHNLFIRVSGNGRGRHVPRLSAVQPLFPKPAVGGVELAPGLDQAVNRPWDGRRFNGHFRLDGRKDASEITGCQQTRAE